MPPVARLGRSAAVAVAVAALAAACGQPFPRYDYAKEPDPRASEVMLGAGDQVAVNVWDNANLNTEATIRADGHITMPLIGDLKAEGETPTSLKAKIKVRLAEFVKSTEVTVAVRAWRSYRFTIQGEVVHPGVFSSEQYVTVAEALALAGGLSRFAKPEQIVVNRRDGKSKERKKIPISYEEIASGRRPDMNIYVLPGDSIWVP